MFCFQIIKPSMEEISIGEVFAFEHIDASKAPKLPPHIDHFSILVLIIERRGIPMDALQCNLVAMLWDRMHSLFLSGKK
jgi:hypothetical protein